MRFREPHRSAIPISLYWQRGRFSLWKTKIFQSASRGTTRDCHADFRSSRYVFRQFNYAIVHMRGRTCGIRSVLSHRLPALVEKSLTPTVHFQRSLRFCATRTRTFRTSLPATWNFFARIARSRHELCPPPAIPASSEAVSSCSSPAPSALSFAPKSSASGRRSSISARRRKGTFSASDSGRLPSAFSLFPS